MWTMPARYLAMIVQIITCELMGVGAVTLRQKYALGRNRGVGFVLCTDLVKGC